MFNRNVFVKVFFISFFLSFLIFIPSTKLDAASSEATDPPNPWLDSMTATVDDREGEINQRDYLSDAQSPACGHGDIPLDEETYQQYLKPVEYPEGMSRLSIPTEYDARDDGIVTTPKNQGACGSCWAFASVGAMESHLIDLGADSTDLSEQQLVSCNTSQIGCCGGSSTAIQFWETAGPIAETCFAYGESSTECTISSPIESTVDCSDASGCTQLNYRVTNYHTVSNSEFKASLYIDGPSYWRFTVYDDFIPWYNSASSGSVYTNATGTNYVGGHAVLLIGWDDSKSAYLLKNSWGATSGPQGDGTFWMAYSGHANDLGFQMANFDLTSTGGDSYEPDNTSGEANTISSGSPQTHSLSPAGDVDWVTFTLTSESGITLETSGSSGDTRLWLYDSSLTEVEYNDDDGINSFSFIDRVCDVDALPAGTYYVQVAEYWANELPSYDLSFNASLCASDSYEPDDSSVEANWIYSGTPQTHSIYPSGDEDWVKFTLPLESGVTLETSGVSGDTRMWLFDDNLTEIENNDDYGITLFSSIDRVCDEDPLPTGTYYVKVDEFGDNDVIASYDLSFNAEPCELFVSFLPFLVRSSGSVSVFNGDFELGHTGWTESSSSGDDLITDAMPVTPHSGSWLAKFGGNNWETDQLSQVVTVPVDQTSLHYWYWIPSTDSLWGWDNFYVKIDGTVVRSIDLYPPNITTGWVEDIVDLAAYSGSEITLTFEVILDSLEPSILYLDDVSLISSGSVGFN